MNLLLHRYIGDRLVYIVSFTLHSNKYLFILIYNTNTSTLGKDFKQFNATY